MIWMFQLSTFPLQEIIQLWNISMSFKFFLQAVKKWSIMIAYNAGIFLKAFLLDHFPVLKFPMRKKLGCLQWAEKFYPFANTESAMAQWELPLPSGYRFPIGLPKTTRSEWTPCAHTPINKSPPVQIQFLLLVHDADFRPGFGISLVKVFANSPSAKELVRRNQTMAR